MIFLTRGKTNWKYILIIFILSVIVGGEVLLLAKIQEFSPIQLKEGTYYEEPDQLITYFGTEVSVDEIATGDLNNDGIRV